MNKKIKMMGLLSLLCFSFYYTEQIASFIKQKDPIYETILAQKEDYDVEVIHGEIIDDYIMPGLNGKVVNVEKSFRKMKGDGYFSESSLVFDEVKPENSLNENLDKKISRGNPYKNYVSFLLEDDTFVSYFEEMNYPYAILTTKENMSKLRVNGLKINNDFSHYQEVEKYLKLKGEENEFCYSKNHHEDPCIQNKKRMIEETVLLNKSNISKNYTKITSGSILYLSSNLDLEHVKLLFHQFYFKGYTVVSLKDLLSETR